MTRVVLFGYDELVLASIDATARADAEVAAVVFPSNRRGGAAGTVREMVRERGHRVLEQPPRPRSGELTAALRELAPDLILVWSYPMILPTDWIRLPEHGAVNLHFGVLPAYRGANGILWALVRGERSTGVALHYMEGDVDSGPVIDQTTFPIRADDDLVSLLRRGRAAGSMLLDHWLPRLVRGRVPSVAQDETLAAYYPPRTDADRRVDWSAGSVPVWNLVRSQPAPFPGAFTLLRGRKVVLRKVRPVKAAGVRPAGLIHAVTAEGVRVATGDGGVLVERVEVDGREVGPEGFAALGITDGARFG